MRRVLFAFLLFLACACIAQAQTTTATGTVIDANGQHFNFISPSGTNWKFTVCPASTSPCYSTSISLQGASENVSSQITPPAITVNGSNSNQPTAYSDAEISGPTVGFLYFNLTDKTIHECTISVPCTWVSIIPAGSGTVQGGPQNAVAIFPISGTNAIVGPSNITTDSTKNNLNVPGIIAAPNINNVVYADQQAGVDFCAKLVAATTRLPAGGTVNALGFQGSQACGLNTSLSQNGVQYLLPANLIVSAAVGITITISASDVQVIGAGDTTLFDFSAGASANPDINITGSRVNIQGIKVVGNRVAVGTAGCVTLSPSTTQDRNTIQWDTFTNCGSDGIYSLKQTNLVESHNTFSSIGYSAIFHDVGESFTRVEDNTVTDWNLDNISGNGGIMFAAVLVTDQQNIQIHHNILTELTAGANHVGIGVNGATGEEMSSNTVIKASGSSGEAIAVTGNNVRVFGNHTLNSGACGILYYATTLFSTGFEISGNFTDNGVSSGVCLVWGQSSVAIQRGIVSGNEMSGNSVYGFQVFANGALTGDTLTDVSVFGNQWSVGNTSGPFNSGGAASGITYFGNQDAYEEQRTRSH